MKINLDGLAVLDAIVRRGSFAGAAAELFRVPSAITYTVRKLEQDLGVTLFERHGQKAHLTPAGEELLHQGRRLLRAAGDLEQRVRRIETGWETELSIAVDSLIPVEHFFPLVKAFYQEKCGTHLRFSTEVYGGTWDALVSGRADLAFGAPGEGPPGGGYGVQFLGMVRFVFALAPDHPLASLPEPLKNEDILAHRAVSAADSSRVLPPRSAGLLSGQEVLMVPDLPSKVAAQCQGLGVGFLPAHLLAAYLESGRLVTRIVEEPKPDLPLWIAWRTAFVGKALAWFLERLRDGEIPKSLLG